MSKLRSDNQVLWLLLQNIWVVPKFWRFTGWFRNALRYLIVNVRNLEAIIFIFKKIEHQHIYSDLRHGTQFHLREEFEPKYFTPVDIMVVDRDNSLAIHHCSGNVLPQQQILILTAHFATTLEELCNIKRTSSEPSDELMMEPCCALKYYPAVEVCQNEKVVTFMEKIIFTPISFQSSTSSSTS